MTAPDTPRAYPWERWYTGEMVRDWRGHWCRHSEAAAALDAARAEIARLRSGGCARDQHTTQYCAEAVAAARERDEARAVLRDCADALGDEGTAMSGDPADEMAWSNRESCRVWRRARALLDKAEAAAIVRAEEERQ